MIRLLAAAMVVAAAIGQCYDPAISRPRTVAGGDFRTGRVLLRDYGCGACHVIPGVRGAVGRVGPPLSGFAGRGYVAGVLPNTPDNLIRWIMDPQEVSPGNDMPDMGVTEAHARDIAAYLYRLR